MSWVSILNIIYAKKPTITLPFQRQPNTTSLYPTASTYTPCSTKQHISDNRIGHIYNLNPINKAHPFGPFAQYAFIFAYQASIHKNHWKQKHHISVTAHIDRKRKQTPPHTHSAIHSDIKQCSRDISNAFYMTIPYNLNWGRRSFRRDPTRMLVDIYLQWGWNTASMWYWMQLILQLIWNLFLSTIQWTYMLEATYNVTIVFVLEQQSTKNIDLVQLLKRVRMFASMFLTRHSKSHKKLSKQTVNFSFFLRIQRIVFIDFYVE